MYQYKRNGREKLKEECIEYLGGKLCRVCNNRSFPIVCYDFHHKNGNKDEEISKMLGRKNKLDDELKNELDKCIMVCANCHRQITYGCISNETLQSLYK